MCVCAHVKNVKKGEGGGGGNGCQKYHLSGKTGSKIPAKLRLMEFSTPFLSCVGVWVDF